MSLVKDGSSPVEKKKISIKIFDTILNGRSRNTTERNYADVWVAFSQLSGWECNYERIHSLADVEYFMNRSIKESVVIFSGHGDCNSFHLSNREHLSPERLREIAPNPRTKGKIVILSACELGKNTSLCNEYKDAFQAKELFAYQHTMLDQYCFLYDSILLTCIAKNGLTKSMFEEFRRNTEFMKNFNQKGVKSHPMIRV